MSNQLRRHTERGDQSQSAQAVAERQSQVIVVEVDTQGKESWRKRQSWLS